MTLVLHAQLRDATSPRALRREGKLPAVVYGPAIGGSKPIALSADEFIRVFRAAGESEVVELVGVEGVRDVLIHDVQFDPLTDAPLHVDLYAIKADQEVEVRVPLVFVGEAPAEKLGGTLVKVLHDIEIAALPRNLPHEITVDVSVLRTFEDKIFAKDLVLPAGVRLIENPEEVVALVVPQSEEVEEEAPAEIDMSAIEVEAKGKKAKEGEEAQEGQEA